MARHIKKKVTNTRLQQIPFQKRILGETNKQKTTGRINEWVKKKELSEFRWNISRNNNTGMHSNPLLDLHSDVEI